MTELREIHARLAMARSALLDNRPVAAFEHVEWCIANIPNPEVPEPDKPVVDPQIVAE